MKRELTFFHCMGCFIRDASSCELPSYLRVQDEFTRRVSSFATDNTVSYSLAFIVRASHKMYFIEVLAMRRSWI